ncbi:MAG: Lysine decarboxylase family [Ktedonobacterales bacterium]|nr:MAG: Lysine decarboxylase family [Ktedonobacterales bacterium]
MKDMRRVCVFAGSNAGAKPVYAETARALGKELARRKLELVYGGASRGLMGIMADATLAAGGKALGVLPRGLFRLELAHTGLTKLYEVGSMHRRKAQMADLADAFIALPGGYGTFDELFEIITWAQIGLHSKPIGLLDVADYFAPLLALVAHAATEGFVPPRHTQLLLRAETPAALLDQLAAYTPPEMEDKWTTEPPER